MKGKHSVKVSDNRVKYSFELVRNITVIQGKSGTGKTTLFEMLSAYARLKERSGVQVICDKTCTVLRPDSDWRIMLDGIKDSIVFIDEESEYIVTPEFALAIKQTDNYYVIFTRENLNNLPYSVEEIYEMHTSGKMHSLRKIYKQKPGYRYSASNSGKKKTFLEVVLTEDSKSGYEFYEKYFEENTVNVISAGANSSIYSWLVNNRDKNVFVIADGAAFGSQMNRVMNLAEHYPNMTICLPESFEYLVLKSGLLKDKAIEKVLEHPEDHIESARYFSWEQFFTDILIQNSKDTYYRYSKSHINRFYLVKSNSDKIIALLGLNNISEVYQ